MCSSKSSAESSYHGQLRRLRETTVRGLEPQDFSFMRSPKLRVIAACDYVELQRILAADGT